MPDLSSPSNPASGDTTLSIMPPDHPIPDADEVAQCFSSDESPEQQVEMDQTSDENLPNDPHSSPSQKEAASPALAPSEAAHEVHEPHQTIPIMMEDENPLSNPPSLAINLAINYHSANLYRAANIRDLAIMIASSEMAYNVYKLQRPRLLWSHFLKCVGPEGVNDLLMCVYIGGKCNAYSVGDGQNLDHFMELWEHGGLRPPNGQVPDIPVIEEMLDFFLRMANLVNRLLAQMVCFQSVWGQRYYGAWPRPIYNLWLSTGLQSI
ncbi:hypothetical protein ACHAPT_010718 [Fusarium lateritium]